MINITDIEEKNYTTECLSKWPNVTTSDSGIQNSFKQISLRARGRDTAAPSDIFTATFRLA